MTRQEIANRVRILSVIEKDQSNSHSERRLAARLIQIVRKNVDLSVAQATDTTTAAQELSRIEHEITLRATQQGCFAF